jgi:hypothetical protein
MRRGTRSGVARRGAGYSSAPGEGVGALTVRAVEQARGREGGKVAARASPRAKWSRGHLGVLALGPRRGRRGRQSAPSHVSGRASECEMGKTHPVTTCWTAVFSKYLSWAILSPNMEVVV